MIALIQRMSTGRKLVVALESSGTYGDALRQALADAQVAVVRVGNKASHDYAEVFDGVPSQHDGKDAAVIAELAALGKAQPWAYQAASPWEQELTYWVEWMVIHRRSLTSWQGRLEGLVARHWPEATRVLKLSSVTLLRVLKEYGDPAALAADPGRPSGSRPGAVAGWPRRRSSGCWPARPRAWGSGSATGNGARSGMTRGGRWRRGRRPGGRCGGCASWPRGMRSCRRRGRRWGWRRRVSCGRARGTRRSIMRRRPTARRWD